MKIDLYKKISFNSFVELFLLFALPVICVCGVSYFPYQLRLPLIYAVAALILVYTATFKGKIRISGVVLLYFLFLSYLALSLLYSYDKTTTFNFLIIYACAFPLLIYNFTEYFSNKLLQMFLIVSMVIAVSIIISVPIKNCMVDYFWFIINPGRNAQTNSMILNELSLGAYSGFAREKGEAAFIMNVGLAVCFAKYFSLGKFKASNVLCVLTLIIALLLTSKRALLIIVVFCVCVLVLVSKIKGKVVKAFSMVLIICSVVFFVLSFVPSLANTFLRFLDTENMQTMGGRSAIWKYLYMMISQYWLFGAGFGSYNNFAYDNGFRVFDAKWNYYGHNIYYEALGEIGVVGCILLFGFFIVSFVRTFKLMRNKNLSETQNKILYFSFYIQLMFLSYGITGNPIYTRQHIFTWVVAICMFLSVYNKVATKKYVNKYKKQYTLRGN